VLPLWGQIVDEAVFPFHISSDNLTPATLLRFQSRNRHAGKGRANAAVICKGIPPGNFQRKNVGDFRREAACHAKRPASKSCVTQFPAGENQESWFKHSTS
jgi:hypothetical protein